MVDAMRVLAEQPQGHHPLPHHRVRHGAQRIAALREYYSFLLPSYDCFKGYVFVWFYCITSERYNFENVLQTNQN